MIGSLLATLALTASTVTGPVPENALPQDHCNGVVCIGAESVGGSGPDIIAAQVETRGLFGLPPYTVIYLEYGPNPTAARKIPLAHGITEPGDAGLSFYIGRVLNPGWVLCGIIVGHYGYPCITIGR